VHLAHSNICHGQAFRYGKKDYGLQFHLEVNQAMIDRFLRVPENRAEVEIFGGKQAIAQVEEETAAYLARSVELNRRTFHEFVRLFGLGERTKTRA
jgi:GMP synthase (glutamine-hydrolysing)